MARRRATRRVPEWAIGLTITFLVLVMVWIRPSFLGDIEDPSQRFQTGEEYSKTVRALKERLDKTMAQVGPTEQGAPPPVSRASRRIEAATSQSTQQFTVPPGSECG